MNYVNLAIYGGAFLLGVGLLPGIIYVLGPELPRSVRGVGARILWTIAALIHGPYAVYYRLSGRVETIPADPETDEIQVDGEWIDLESDGNWTRLGKQRAVVTYEKGIETFDGTTVNEKAEDVEQTPAYLGVRGGQLVATRFKSTAENIVVDLGRVCSRWRGAAGGSLSDAAKKEALVDYGGQVDLSTKWLVMGILGSLALGVMSGWMLLG